MTNKTTQQNIPEGWKLVKLKEISKKIGSGVTPRGGFEVYTKEGVIFLRSQNIQNGYLSLADVEYISDEIDTRMSNSKVEKNDILYNITGASIGRSALYTLDDKANVNQHVCIIRLKNEDPRFVNYFLRSSLGGKQLDSFQAGGNRQGLNYNQLGSFKFLLPRKAEQDRIVAVLETWDQAIEKLKRKIEVKKEIKKGLMQELLTGKTRLTGFADKWKVFTLSELAEINPKTTILPEKFIYIDLESVTQGKLLMEKRITAELAPSRAQRILKRGDVIFQTVRPYQRNNLYFDCEGDYVASTGYAQLRSWGDSKFLYYLLHTERFVSDVLSRCTGSNYPAINSTDLGEIELKAPPNLREQVALANILTTADKEINQLEHKLLILKDQKKYLLNNLVTGIIRTPETLSIPK